MRPLSTIIPLLLAVVSQASLAQDSAPLPSRYAESLSTPTDPDKMLLSEVNNSRRKIESSLKDYFVAFDSRHDSDRKRLGFPLASFANSLFNIAYDISGRNVMAQWTFSQSSAHGNKFHYHAYVGESGVVSFVISANF